MVRFIISKTNLIGFTLCKKSMWIVKRSLLLFQLLSRSYTYINSLWKKKSNWSKRSNLQWVLCKRRQVGEDVFTERLPDSGRLIPSQTPTLVLGQPSSTFTLLKESPKVFYGVRRTSSLILPPSSRKTFQSVEDMFLRLPILTKDRVLVTVVKPIHIGPPSKYREVTGTDTRE